MTTFQSSEFQVSVNSSELSAFLSTPSNLIEILPQDRIEDWTSSGDECSFKIKGLAHICLRLSEQSDEKVVYENTSDKPFPFKLNIYTSSLSGNCELSASFDAEVNSFMKMMLQKPLTNFLDGLGSTISKKYA